MIDLALLVKDTNAYRQIKRDKEMGKLSHAYLLLTADGDKLNDYLKFFASLMVCEEGFPCGKCRSCKLIMENAYSDVHFYPEDNRESVVVEDINALIEESYLKPVESDKKIFIITHAESMNPQSQNKLLKTLEEPPKNVHIILGATSEYALLPTIKSRVKKLEIPPFSQQKLFDALKEDYTDSERLFNAVCCGDGTVGKAISLYDDKQLEEITHLASDLIVNMNSSRDILHYSTLITNLKCDVKNFLSVLELIMRDMLVMWEGKDQLVKNKLLINELKKAKNFSRGAILMCLEKINECYKRLKFNANATMLVEWLLFQILESKYKWQKL